MNVPKHMGLMPISVETDERIWLEKARDGDEDSFAMIVHHYQGPVYNLCYRMLGDALEAEDAAQETFIRAYRNLKRFDPERKFINWLLTIASNHCVDRLRKKRMKFVSMDSLLPGDHLVDRNKGPEEQLDISEAQQEIQTLINQLSPKDRAAIILKYWHDQSYEEIARSLSLSVSAVKSRLHRARRELVELWDVDSAIEMRRHDEASAI
jgi:RNA polymerase sigma-70 factor (ECF subfamily)